MLHPTKLIYMDCTFPSADQVNVRRYVEEATKAFEIRVQACLQRHEDHLHVYLFSSHSEIIYRIVGKGVHSANHLAKLRPEIEKLCRQHNFKYFVEENEGRILVKFGEGAGQLSQGEATSFWSSQQQQGQQPPPESYQQRPHQGQQQYQGQQSQGENNDMVEQAVKKAAPIVFRKLMSCCTIM